MEKQTLIKNLSKCLMCFLFSAFLTTSPVCAGSDKAGVTDKIRMHMQTAGLNQAEISEKLTKLEEKLTTGMSFEDSCTQCHADKMVQGSKQ